MSQIGDVCSGYCVSQIINYSFLMCNNSAILYMYVNNKSIFVIYINDKTVSVDIS